MNASILMRFDGLPLLMTQRLWDSPAAPVIQCDFWTSAYQAIDD
jgi:hypothetical protein